MQLYYLQQVLVANPQTAFMTGRQFLINVTFLIRMVVHQSLPAVVIKRTRLPAQNGGPAIPSVNHPNLKGTNFPLT